jgi:hypothetical protein
MSERALAFDSALQRVTFAVTHVHNIESSLKEGKATTRRRKSRKRHLDTHPAATDAELKTMVREVLDACVRKRVEVDKLNIDISDATLSRMAQFTDRFNLLPYEHFISYVPRLVNIVTVRTQMPRPPPPPLFIYKRVFRLLHLSSFFEV